MRQLISSGSSFERDIGYSRAVVDGGWVFVSGTTGFDYSTMTIRDSIAEQTEQCLKNIEQALAQAGATLADPRMKIEIQVTAKKRGGADCAPPGP